MIMIHFNIGGIKKEIIKINPIYFEKKILRWCYYL